ncbi:reductive dehalogenase [Dehalobacter sp. 14DCB1]|uniref:reductive dehalogenase n=1 Tax=Dehalobacter sp. 14DCB1 TaxID=2070227 RepID=UPI0010462477|nr:reductive dehalogenase [Dehalobacter sp. 14DCB1]TCX53511.1 reductive dehalogenase [Dehalobacter sp. 14DCB1]
MAKEKFNTDEPATKVNRRQFLKFGAGASTGIAIAAATTALEGRSLIDPKQVYAGTTKALDEFPFDIPADYKPFTGQRSIYGRLALGDKSLQAAKESFYAARWNGYLKDGSPGYTVLDGAAARACFAFEYYFQGVNGAGVANKGPFTWHPKVNEFAFRWGDPERNIHSPGVKSAEEGTMAVKKMAKTLGAHSVGIASFDRRFVYNETLAYVDPNPLSVTDGTAKKFIPSDFGFEPKHAIVMTIPMAYEGISCAPTFLGSTQVGLAYAKMGFAAFSLSMFIKDLGYHAVPIGSDTALSIPMAIQAGLGEYSRMGLLVTPDLGPSVRICKVFTDMPLNHDKPISFGVTEFCNSCKKCADQCPAQAISSDAPTTDGPCGDMQNSGIKRWYMDPVKCFSSWGGDNISSCCGACIASCPFTKPEGWHHTLVRSVTGTPGITPIMKNMDDIFGYGKLYDEQAIADWWKK